MRLKIQYQIWCLGLFTVLLLSACAAVPPAPRKIVLLAPFEGQYREIGYEALYAAQLALKEHDTSGHYLLLPLDDGGTEATAKERAKALTYDDSIALVLALGPYSTTPDVQASYGVVLPVIIIGWWPSIWQQYDLNRAVLSADLREQLPTIADPYLSQDQPLTGGEILSLPQFDDREDCVIWSSIPYASEGFINRYKAMNEFAPPPRLIAPLTYEATFIAIATLKEAATLRGVLIQDMYALDRPFETSDGYWLKGTPAQYECGV